MTVSNCRIFFSGGDFQLRCVLQYLCICNMSSSSSKISWKKKSKLTGSWGSMTKGFQLSLKNSSISDHFLNFFESSCTPPEILGQLGNFLLLFFISVAFAIGYASLGITKVSGGSSLNRFQLLIFRLFAFWVSLPYTKLSWQSFTHPPNL